MPQNEITQQPENDPLAVALIEAAAAFATDRMNTAPAARRQQIGALMTKGAQPGVMVRVIDESRVLTTVCLVDTDGNVMELSQHILQRTPPTH